MLATKEGKDRVTATAALRERLEPLLQKAGGIDRVKASDMARIASKVHGDWPLDSAMTTVAFFLAGRALDPNEIDKLSKLADHLESSADARQEWFALLRDVLGLDASVSTGGRWPFTVKTVPIEAMFADFEYQRPVQEVFVRDMVLRFDERLVGVLNVSLRPDGTYALIDGLQRMTAMSRLGKTAAYACIHERLSQQQEAALFYHHNRDRKPVHPYYDFRARLVAGDPCGRGDPAHRRPGGLHHRPQVAVEDAGGERAQPGGDQVSRRDLRLLHRGQGRLSDPDPVDDLPDLARPALCH